MQAGVESLNQSAGVAPDRNAVAYLPASGGLNRSDSEELDRLMEEVKEENSKCSIKGKMGESAAQVVQEQLSKLKEGLDACLDDRCSIRKWNHLSAPMH